MGKRKERRLAAKTNAGRRVKLDLFAEPSGTLSLSIYIYTHTHRYVYIYLYYVIYACICPRDYLNRFSLVFSKYYFSCLIVCVSLFLGFCFI